MPIFPLYLSNRPLAENSMRAIISATHCTLLYRFDHVHVVDQEGNEYHICHTAGLATLSVRQFTAALSKALSYHPR